jgi:hypothetical protein
LHRLYRSAIVAAHNIKTAGKSVKFLKAANILHCTITNYHGIPIRSTRFCCDAAWLRGGKPSDKFHIFSTT